MQTRRHGGMHRKNTPKKSVAALLDHMQNGRWRKTLTAKDSHLAPYLKRECQGGQCVIFGTHFDRVKTFFDNFDIQSGLVDEITDIEYSNVRRLRFSKNGFTCYALAKTQDTVSAPNLMYEYAVGMFINRYCASLPCFVYTHGIYLFKDTDSKQKFSSESSFVKSLPDSVVSCKKPFTSNDHCTGATRYLLLTHFLEGSIELSEFLMDEDAVTISSNIIGIMYQIYYGLNVLGKSFAHWDLHAKNVLLYKSPGPIRFRYINYVGDTDTESITIDFTCQYTAKIIDYGLSEFKGSRDVIESGKRMGCKSTVFPLHKKYRKQPDFNDIYLLHGTMEKVLERLDESDSKSSPETSSKDEIFTTFVEELIDDVNRGEIKNVKGVMKELNIEENFMSYFSENLPQTAAECYAALTVNGRDPAIFKLS